MNDFFKIPQCLKLYGLVQVMQHASQGVNLS